MHILISANIGPEPSQTTMEELLLVAASMKQMPWAKSKSKAPSNERIALQDKALSANSSEELQQLLEDPKVLSDSHILIAVLRNKHVSQEILQKLSRVSFADVKQGAS